MYNLQGKEKIGESLYIFQKVLCIIVPVFLAILIALKAPLKMILWVAVLASLIKMIALLFYKISIWNHIKLILKKLGGNPQDRRELELRDRILEELEKLKYIEYVAN